MSRPRLRLGRHLWRGIGAVGLFAVIAAATLNAEFAGAQGFPEGESITRGLGHALFNFGGPPWYGEGFLAAFILIAVVLDVALDGSLMLAKREDE